MKNIILITSLLFLISCEKNERLLFNDNQSIYLKSFSNEADSLTTSLVTKSKGELDTVYIKVQLLGKYLEKPRKFKLEIIDDKTTAIESKHFKPLEKYYEFPPEVPVFNLPIILIKGDAILQKKSVTLALKLKEAELKTGFKNKQYVRIIFSDMFIAPESEGGYYSNLQQFVNLFGVYSQTKHRMIFEYLGEDLPTEQYGMYYKNFDPKWIACSKYLSDYCRDNEVIDENGYRIFPWR